MKDNFLLRKYGVHAQDVEHGDEVGSFVFRACQPFHFERLGNFLASILKVYVAELLHYKGWLYFDGCANRVEFQGQGDQMVSKPGSEWGGTETKESVMIFIGRNLPREALASGLEQCLVTSERVWKP